MDGLNIAPSCSTILHYYRVLIKYPGWTACTLTLTLAAQHYSYKRVLTKYPGWTACTTCPLALWPSDSCSTILHCYRVLTRYPGWTACTTRPLAAPPHLLSTTTTDWSLDRASLTGTGRTTLQQH